MLGKILGVKKCELNGQIEGPVSTGTMSMVKKQANYMQQ
jgi:hypothetical protein